VGHFLEPIRDPGIDLFEHASRDLVEARPLARMAAPAVPALRGTPRVGLSSL
jgi:hypothetical protein